MTMSAVGRLSGAQIDWLYCGSFLNGLVQAKHITWCALLPCLRIFFAVRVTKWVMASSRLMQAYLAIDFAQANLPLLDTDRRDGKAQLTFPCNAVITRHAA